MSSRKKRNAVQFLALLVIVIAIVSIVYGVQHWWNNRPGTQPQDVRLSVSLNGTETEVSPYSVCEIGTDCEEGTVYDIALGPDDIMTIDLPPEIYSSEWSLLKIYDNPAANDQSTFGANQQRSVDIKGSTEPLDDSGTRPLLVVVEISVFMIGTDENGEEIPYTVTWSIHSEDTVINAQ